jgi:hypothetical protein
MLAYVVGVTTQEGVTEEVDPSLQLAVAVYVAVLLSFTEEGPSMVRPVKVMIGTLMMITVIASVFVTPPEV